VTHQTGDGTVLARRAIDNGYDLVMVYGGDGTLLDVAQGMLDQDVPMGILPGGTANALAEELRIPMKLAAAARLVCENKIHFRSIDVGKVGEHYFLVRIGTGMIATLSEGVTRDLKDRFGLGAYFISGITALKQPQYVTYTLTIDGKTIQTEGAACLVTNGNSFGLLRMTISQHIHVDDGLLDVFILNTDLQTIVGLASSIAGIEKGMVSLQHWQGRSITIETNPPQRIFADGENTPIGMTPCTIEIVPNALQVVVPELHH